jgi:hypothetical protein
VSWQNVEIVRGFVGPTSGEDLVPLMRELVERFGPDFPRDPILAYWAEDPAWRHMDPGIEWISELPGLSQNVTGPSELLGWWKELIEAWESYTYTTVELRDLGDWVLNVADVCARGRQGVDVEMRVYELAEVRDGKIASYRAAVRSEAEALKAVGLG